MPAIPTPYALPVLDIRRLDGDVREQVDVGPEKDALPPGPDAPAWGRLKGSDQWPAALAAFRPAVLAYQEAGARLAIRLLRAFAAALGHPEDAFAPISALGSHHLLEIVRYPGRAEEDRQGVGAHKHEVGHNALKDRLRSHPDAARRHHADLLSFGAFA